MYVCMYACTYVCNYVCMYAIMYVCIIYIYIYTYLAEACVDELRRQCTRMRVQRDAHTTYYNHNVAISMQLPFIVCSCRLRTYNMHT